MVRPVGAAISRPPAASPEWFGPSALSRKVGGRLIAAPTVFPPGLGPYGMVRLVPSSVTGFARATFPVGEGFLRRGTKPSPGRGWLGEAETGVGRYEPGPGTAPLPALGGNLPPGEGRRDFLRKTSKFMLTFWVFNGKIPEPHQEGLQVLPKSSRLESETTH